MAYAYDETNPGDSDVISLYPDNERAERLTNKNIVTEEHDEATGHHDFPIYTSAVRDGITDWVGGSFCLVSNITAGLTVLTHYDGADWINTVGQYLGVNNNWTKAQYGTYVELPSTTIIGSDWTLSNFFWVTLDGSGPFTLENPNPMPTAGYAGTWVYQLIQDGTGDRLISTYGNKFKFPHNVEPQLSRFAGAIDFLYCTLRKDGAIHAVLSPDSL